MSLIHCHELELAQCIDNVRAAHPELHLFGLIDGTRDNPSLDQFFLLAPEAEYDPLFLQTDHAACLPHSPYLFTLPDADDTFLREWGYLAEQGVIWWLSATGLTEQAQHWRSLLTVFTPEANTALFRFWDSRVLSTYLQHCSSEDIRQLLAPCHTLFAPDGSRYWRIWSDIKPDTPLLLKESPWWQIQPGHLQGFNAAFERLLVDDIEDKLWRTEPTRLENIYAPALPLLIQHGIHQAQTLGLTHDDALTMFVRCQIRFGSDYWQHESLAPLWQTPMPRDQAFLSWAQPILA